MSSAWQVLAGNLAIVALFVLGWGQVRFWLRAMPGATRSALFGLVMGLGAVASMLVSAEITPGRFLDLRLSLVAVSASFGGPLAAGITLLLALPFRLVMGGAGILPALATMSTVALAGLAGRSMVPRGQTKIWHGLALGLATALISALGMTTIPSEEMLRNMIPLAVVSVITTGLAGLVFLQARRFSAEYDLLSAAFSQSPDLSYVKDRHGRFAAVNEAVARLHGFADPRAMIGTTDFDFDTPERAQMLFDTEQQIMDSGRPQLDVEEQFVDETGTRRWSCTSRVPLRAPNGEMIGMAGVTRDITEDRQLRHDLTESRNTLSYALAEMSDGLAMFDVEGRILLCNDQYRSNFPHTATLRQPGNLLRDVLRKVIETGEQINLPADTDAWIEEIIANLQHESEEVVHLFDGRWLQVRTRPTTEDKALVVVTDVTRIKQAELALSSATDQLKHLVRTDSLTGLLNRRAFDDAMETEIARSARAATPMSVLMIDVDRFKAYNDRYGHPAGDECLKLVAEHLRKALKRPADTAARYGGEEFVAILPDTDEDGAYLVAEAFRRSLAEARIPHAGSERGYLTASVGVATYMQDNLHRRATEIIEAADEALYGAKAAGRDRVFGARVTRKQHKYGTTS